MNGEKLIFKPRARLMLQLGEQLIRNEGIALLELIKNAYDADASKVTVIMKNLEDPENGIIIVEDDGCGMTEDIIKNVWMEPGSDYKENLFKKKIRTPKFRRLPLGEKGIGRFAAHKLGELITLITRAENHPEILLEIDWSAFEKSKYLEEVPIRLITRNPEVFKNRTGTRIEIRKLRSPWTRGMLRDVYRSVLSLTSPFDDTQGSFNVDFKTDYENWIKDLLSIEDVKDWALFRFRCVLEGNRISKFSYEFTPLSSMTKITGRTVDETDQYIKKRLFLVDKEGEINLNRYHIGPVIFEGFIFDLDTKILSLGVQDKKALREYLKINGGIRVYRDGIRVYDYGEPGNDWLDLGTRRINEPTKRISNNIIVAAVHLSREKSTDLREKTNREGFIENDAFRELKRALLYTLGQIEELRYEDKEKIRSIYGLKITKVKEPVEEIEDLRNLIKKEIKEERLKKDIFSYLDKIGENYKEIRERLLRAAGAGLTLSIVIHEIDKITAELKIAVKKQKEIERIKNLVGHLTRLVESYIKIIKKDKTEKCNIKDLIDQAIFSIEFRSEAHEIEIIKEYKKKDSDIYIRCLKGHFIRTIMNIIDNSIWWLDYKYRQQKFKKKIFIDVSECIEDHICIIIADNGPGLTLPPEIITEPFVSAKPDGMGLGLYIADEIMKEHGGFLKFPERDEVNIPEEFREGAIILLAFKRGVRNDPA